MTGGPEGVTAQHRATRRTPAYHAGETRHAAAHHHSTRQLQHCEPSMVYVLLELDAAHAHVSAW
jgi:hypothetical protein